MPAPRGLKLAVLLAFAALVAAKALFASRTGLFADEAFYWQCGRRLDLAYADHPFMTALLVRAGTAVLGDTWLGVRLAFLVLGAALPVAVWFLARPVTGERNAWLAAAVTMLPPVLAIDGAVAVPDAPLLLFSVAGLAAFERATRNGAPGAWFAAGAAAALGFCTHYRFALVVAAAAAYLVATRAGRGHLRTRGPWLAAAVAAAGLVPVAVFNAAHGFAPLRYQFFERHVAGARGPGAWLVHPVEQAAVVTPLLYAALLVALVSAWRRGRAGDDRSHLLAVFATVPLGTYFLTSPLADDDLAHFHWPALGLVPLAVLVPQTLGYLAGRGGWRRALAFAAPATAGLATCAVLLGVNFDLFSLRERLRAFSGWSEIAAEVRARLPAAGQRPIVVADSYRQAAEIDFELGGGADVLTLDHEKNRIDGRALQYRIWELDEAALPLRAGRDALVVVESSEFGPRDLARWTRRVRRHFESAEQSGAITIPVWRKPREFLFIEGRRIRP